MTRASPFHITLAPVLLHLENSIITLLPNYPNNGKPNNFKRKLSSIRKPLKPTNRCKWWTREPWNIVEKPSHFVICGHRPPKTGQLINKWSLSSLNPQFAIHPWSLSAKTRIWTSLSYVGTLFRNSRQAKIETLIGTTFNHRD